MRLDGKAALVTGSTLGIGRATALALAAEGAHVVVHGRDATRGQRVVQEITAAGGRADLAVVDLAGGGAAVRDLVDQASELGGGHIDVLVNNAAIMHPGPETEEQIDAMLAVNIKVPYLLIEALAPRMAQRGGGAVVNIGSIAAKIGNPGLAVFAATNATKHALTRTAAAQYGPAGVRVNTVAPGMTAVEKTVDHREQMEAALADTPSRRASTPAEIAAAVVFLASADASNIHGAELFVDGGHTAV